MTGDQRPTTGEGALIIIGYCGLLLLVAARRFVTR